MKQRIPSNYLSPSASCDQLTSSNIMCNMIIVDNNDLHRVKCRDISQCTQRKKKKKTRIVTTNKNNNIKPVSHTRLPVAINNRTASRSAAMLLLVALSSQFIMQPRSVTCSSMHSASLILSPTTTTTTTTAAVATDQLATTAATTTMNESSIINYHRPSITTSGNLQQYPQPSAAQSTLAPEISTLAQGSKNDSKPAVFQYHLSHSRPPSLVQMNIQSLVDKTGTQETGNVAKHQHAFFVRAYQLLRELAIDTKRHQILRLHNNSNVVERLQLPTKLTAIQSTAYQQQQQATNDDTGKTVQNITSAWLESSPSTATTNGNHNNYTSNGDDVDLTSILSSDNGDINLKQMQLQVPLQLHLKLKPLPLPLPPPVEPAGKQRRSLASSSTSDSASSPWNHHHHGKVLFGPVNSRSIAGSEVANERMSRDYNVLSEKQEQVPMKATILHMMRRPRPPSKTIPFTHNDAKLETPSSSGAAIKIVSINDAAALTGVAGSRQHTGTDQFKLLKSNQLGNNGYHTQQQQQQPLHYSGNQHHYQQQQQQQQRGPQSPTTTTTITTTTTASTPTTITYDGGVSNGRRPPHWTTSLSGIDELTTTTTEQQHEQQHEQQPATSRQVHTTSDQQPKLLAMTHSSSSNNNNNNNGYNNEVAAALINRHPLNEHQNRHNYQQQQVDQQQQQFQTGQQMIKATAVGGGNFEQDEKTGAAPQRQQLRQQQLNQNQNYNNLNLNSNLQKSSTQLRDSNTPLESFREVVVSPATTTATAKIQNNKNKPEFRIENTNKPLENRFPQPANKQQQQQQQQQLATTAQSSNRVQVPLSEFWLGNQQAGSLAQNQYQIDQPVSQERMVKFWPVEASAQSSAGSVSFLQSYYNQVLRKAPIESQLDSNRYPMVVKDYDMMTTTDGSKRHIVSASQPQPQLSKSVEATSVASQTLGYTMSPQQHSQISTTTTATNQRAISDLLRDGQKVASESAPRSVVSQEDAASFDLSAVPSTTTTTTVLPPVAAVDNGLDRYRTTASPIVEVKHKHRKHKKAVQQQKGSAATSTQMPNLAKSMVQSVDQEGLPRQQHAQYPVSIGITNAPSTSVKRVTTLHNGTNVLITVTSSSSVVSSSSFNNSGHHHHHYPLTTLRPSNAMLTTNDLTSATKKIKLWSMKEYPTTTSTTTRTPDVTTLTYQNHQLAEGRLNEDYGSSLARQVPQPPTPTVASTAAAILMASEMKQQSQNNNNSTATTTETTPLQTSETTTVTIKETTMDTDSDDDSDVSTATDISATTTTSTTTTSTTTPKPKHTTGRATKRKRYHNQQPQLHSAAVSSKSTNNKGPMMMSLSMGIKDEDQVNIATSNKKSSSSKSSSEENGATSGGGNIKLFHFKRKPDLKKFPFYNGGGASLNGNATTIDNLPAATTTTTIISSNAKELFNSELSGQDEADNESSLRKYDDQVPALKERAGSNYVQIKPIATKIAGSSSSSIVLRGTTATTAATNNNNRNANTSSNNRPYSSVDHQTQTNSATHKAITTKPSSRLDDDSSESYDDEERTPTTSLKKTETTVIDSEAETNGTTSANADDSNKPIIRLRRKHGDNVPSEQQYNTLGLLNALGQPRQFFKNRHKQHQPPSTVELASEQVKNHSQGVSLFPSPIMIRVPTAESTNGEQQRNEDIVSRKSRARSFTSSSSLDNNYQATIQQQQHHQQQQNSERRSDDTTIIATGTERKPLTNLGAINAHGSNAIVLFRHPKKDRRRLESLIQSSNYYRVLISMMKPQQQRELMDLMISKNKSLADAAATYMMNEKNIQLLSAMQLHNRTLMQQQQSNGELMTGNNENAKLNMEEEASQRKASFVEPSTTSSSNMEMANNKPSHMFTSLIGNTPDSNLYSSAKRQMGGRDAETRNQQQPPQRQQDISTKKVPKLLMKPMRPAKYSLNGYIPKPSLSLLSKDLDSSSTTNEVFSRRKGGINNNQQQTGQNGRPPIASTSAKSSSDLSNVKPRSLVLSPQKANLIKARLGLLNTDASERKVSVAPDFDASSDNLQPSDTGDKSTALNTIPKTDFECTDKQGKFISGVFADYKTGCQVWHLCSSNRKYSFLCPTGTIFNAKLRICDWQYNIKCQDSRI